MTRDDMLNKALCNIVSVFIHSSPELHSGSAYLLQLAWEKIHHIITSTVHRCFHFENLVSHRATEFMNRRGFATTVFAPGYTATIATGGLGGTVLSYHRFTEFTRCQKVF